MGINIYSARDRRKRKGATSDCCFGSALKKEEFVLSL